MKTIEQLEGKDWGSPIEGESYLVNTLLRLRRKPIDRFSIENMRLMIGQNIGTQYLMPRALDALESDPLAEGDFHPGDLLFNVVRLPDNYWHDRDSQRERAIGIARRGLHMLSVEGCAIPNRELVEMVRGELQSFIWRHERMRTTVTTS